MNRIGILFLILVSVSLFAENPSVAHFCVQDFVKDRNSYDLVIRPVGKIVPEQNMKWPDSLTCGKLIWNNKLVVEYKNEQIVFKEGYDADLDSNICNICTDEERSRKKAVPAPLENELEAYQYYTYDIISRGKKRLLDKSFVKDLYGKKLSAEWSSALSCVCPSYGIPGFETKLDIVIDGECAHPAASSAKARSLKKESEVNSECSCSAHGKCAEEGENTSLPEGVAACYYYASPSYKKADYYVSSNTMGLDGQPEGTDASLGCFDIRGETYMVVGSNLPSLRYSSNSFSMQGTCYVNVDNSWQRRNESKPYYSCETKKSTPNGCKTVEEGVNLVFDSNGKFTGWDYDALSEYAERQKEKSQMKAVLLPAKITGNVLAKVADNAAQKTAGMAYYCGTKRVGYEKYERNHLSSLKEALDLCKARSNPKRCKAIQAREDSIAQEQIRRDKEWQEERRKKREAEKKAYFDKVKVVKNRLKKDSAYIKLTQAYKFFKKYAVQTEASLKKGVDYAKVLDTLESLRNPFFDRLHQRSEPICKGKTIQNDTLKSLNEFLLFVYTNGYKDDYFVENGPVYYTTEPCVYDTYGVPHCVTTTKVDTFCVDTKGTKAKRIFLTDEDREILDVFMGCNSWTEKRNAKEVRYKQAFLPIESAYDDRDNCYSYGGWIGVVYLDLVNKDKAVLYNRGLEVTFEKIDGNWKRTESSVDVIWFE